MVFLPLMNFAGRIDADVEVVEQQVVVRTVAAVLAAQDVGARAGASDDGAGADGGRPAVVWTVCAWIGPESKISSAQRAAGAGSAGGHGM